MTRNSTVCVCVTFNCLRGSVVVEGTVQTVQIWMYIRTNKLINKAPSNVVINIHASVVYLLEWLTHVRGHCQGYERWIYVWYQGRLVCSLALSVCLYSLWWIVCSDAAIQQLWTTATSFWLKASSSHTVNVQTEWDS